MVTTVLLVEDDEDFGADVRSLLSLPGSPVSVPYVAGSCAEARAWLAQGHSPDVGLVDLGLPDGSGVRLIAEGRRLSPHTAWVAFTVFDDAPTVFSALEAGATGYLLKSTSPAKLRDALLDAASGGSPMSSAVARLVVDRVAGRPVHDEGVDALAPRELEVLSLLARGVSYAEAARLLGIGHGTVQTYVKAIYRKLHVSTKAEAAAIAVRAGRS